jgi:cell wall-associated NlpC family hydrolase
LNSWLRWSAGVILLLAGLTGCATLPIPSRPAPDKERAQAVIRTAKELLGTPYCFGGTSPKGFDCSGFVQYVFRKAVGVRLPRTSPAQFSATVPVRMGEEHPSDLLFWSVDGGGPSHVGIYLGHGQFIHSPEKGDVVKISDGNTRYWRDRFLGVRRVLE